MKSTKPSKIQTVKATKLDSSSKSTNTLRIIDHTVRGAFITLSVTVLSLSFLGAAAAIFSAQPSDYAKAQGVPTDPGVGGVELPGSNPLTPQLKPNVIINSVTKVGDNLQITFTKNGPAQATDIHPHFNFKVNSVLSQPALVYDGASPYVLISSLVPTGATEICVTVFKGDDAPYAGSGNCMAIPTTSSKPDTGTGTPTIDTPKTPTVGGETIGVGADGTESVSTTGTTTTTPDPNITQTQALNAAQTSGTTARSGGGFAFASGLVLLSIVGYYVYYKVHGDRKSILKMAEKRINLKK